MCTHSRERGGEEGDPFDQLMYVRIPERERERHLTSLSDFIRNANPREIQRGNEGEGGGSRWVKGVKVS